MLAGVLGGMLAWAGMAHGQWGQAVLNPVAVGPGNDQLGHSSLALDLAGTLHLVYDRWVGGGNHDFYYTKKPMGEAWTASVLVGDSTANLLNPYLAVHKPSGFAYLVYLQNGALKLAIRKGFFWTYADLPTPGMDALFSPALTVGINGYAHVAVVVQTGGVYKIGCGYWDGFAFHFQVIQNSELGDYGSGAGPDICVTFDGGVAIAYRGGNYTVYRIDVAENAVLGGTNWDVQTIYQPDYNCYEASIKATPNDDLHLAYFGDMGWGFPGRVFYASKPDGAHTWSPSTQISGTFSGVAPKLAMTDYDSAAHVLFEERSGNILTGNICCATNQAGSWVAQYLQQGDKYSPSLVMDNAPSTNGSMCYMQYAGSSNHDVYYYGYVGIGAGPSFPIELTPLNPPIQIPPTGGTFSFVCEISNPTYLAVVIDAWGALLLPDGTLLEPIFDWQNFGIVPFSSRSRRVSQSLPARAPAGTYYYLAFSGEYPLGVADMDTFSFVKLGSDDSFASEGFELSADDCKCREVEPVIEDGWTPSRATLVSSPNPFNPSTLLSFQLPVSSRVSLRVYDTAGRSVRSLVDGWREAGSHEVIFDGANLPSGIYIYRLQAGEFSARGKMVLLK
jgi:hypothetical protein